jgi:hypothetical protein
MEFMADSGKRLTNTGVFIGDYAKPDGSKGRFCVGPSLDKNWQIFFDKAFGGPIISAIVDLFSGVLKDRSKD